MSRSCKAGCGAPRSRGTIAVVWHLPCGAYSVHVSFNRCLHPWRRPPLRSLLLRPGTPRTLCTRRTPRTLCTLCILRTGCIIRTGHTPHFERTTNDLFEHRTSLTAGCGPMRDPDVRIVVGEDVREIPLALDAQWCEVGDVHITGPVVPMLDQQPRSIAAARPLAFRAHQHP